MRRLGGDVRGVARGGGFALAVAVVLLGSAMELRGQGAPTAQESTDSAMAVIDDPLTVHLFTAGPGGAVWERFGHNGIWIHDARTGQDIVWEWGIFSFQSDDFIPRLARGTMLYSMGGRALSDMVSVYERQGRDVWAQELALTPAQEFELQRRILENAQPGNRDYIYDYYLDNCSTRVRDHLDAVLGGAIAEQTRGRMTGRSWRDHTLRLLRPSPPAWAGIQFVLGRPGDAEIDVWEELFLPMRLRAHLAEVTVPGPDGTPRPLVVREVQLADGDAYEVTEAQPIWWPIALGIAAALGGSVFLLLRGAAPGAARSRVAGLLIGGWAIVIGLAGTILALAWLFTDHDFWRWNENLFVASPLTLLWGFLGLRLLLGRSPGAGGMRLAGLLAALAGVALLLQLIPGGQGTLSAALVGASLPLGAWFGLRAMSRA